MQAVKTKQPTELTEQEFNYLWYFRSVFVLLLGVDIIIFDRVSNQPLFYWGVLLVLIGGISTLYFDSQIERIIKRAFSRRDILIMRCVNELQTRCSGVPTTSGVYNSFHFTEKEKIRDQWFRMHGIVPMNSGSYPLIPWNSLCALIKKSATEAGFINAFEHRGREILVSPECSEAFKDETRYKLMNVLRITPKTVEAYIDYIPMKTLLLWRDHEDTEGFTPESRFAVITEITRRSIKG